MTQERIMHSDLRAMLMANEPFEYAHLIKFERPTRPDGNSGIPSTASVRYTYLTDASRNIGFDDGSKDSNGASNGTQIYQANKVLKVSEVSETVEAKASNFSVTLDGNGLGAELGAQSMTITSVSTGVYDIEIINKLVDPVDEGFREGDKITLYGGQTGSFNIQNFRSNNVIRVTKIDTNLTPGTYTMGISLGSEEIKSILLDKTAPEYASFINREVYIYKLYQKDGTTVGAPILLFKGIINNVSFDDSDKGITVQWGLTSHWGDFAQVKGRISSDDFHRALDQNGVPQPSSALKTEYAYDLGFIHAETSLNMLSTYIVQVEKTKVKAKNGILGIGAKTKVKKYYVDESRHTQLDFQLAARSIPLHYGVRITEGYPIFADTLNNDSSTVYVIYMLGEGPIGGIYDIIIDGKSLICSNKADLDARGAQTPDKSIPVVCLGRADRGDVLGGTTSVSNTTSNFYENNTTASGVSGFADLYRILRNRISGYNAPTTASFSTNGKGLVHGESITLTSPIDMTLDFFEGNSYQEASPQLVALAKEKKFKVQNDYWNSPDIIDYWTPNHRLLDTAYVVCKFKISEGETTIPSLEFIIHSKMIECYNYDYSYKQYAKATGENADNFALGSMVTLKNGNTNAVINSSVQIVDKWTMTGPSGVIETRFRFSAAPNLGYTDGVPTLTKFYMEQGANRWTMTTFNHVEHSGTVAVELTASVTPVDDGGALGVPVPGDLGTGGTIVSTPGGSTAYFGDISGGTIRTIYDFRNIIE